MILLGDGRVMVAGGIDLNDESSAFSPEPTKKVDIFDPASNTWQQAAPMSAASEDLWLFLLNDGQVLAISGESKASSDSPVYAQFYDPDSDTWTVVDSADPYYLPTGAVQLSDGRILVAGVLNFSNATGYGYSGDLLTYVSLPDGREYYGNRIREVFPDAKVYDPGTDTWTATLGNTGARSSASMTLLRDGRVLMAGGDDPRVVDFTEPRAIYYTTTAIYDPKSNSWSPGPNLAEGRSDHSATLAPDGRVIFLGGIGLVEVGGGRVEVAPLNTLESIDSTVMQPVAVPTPEAAVEPCETVPIPAPSPDLAPAAGSQLPKDILGAAHTAMSAMASYRVELHLAVVDDETDSGFSACRRVAIDFQAPDRERIHKTWYGALYDAFSEHDDLSIVIGAFAYRSNPRTGEWEIATAIYFPDPLYPIKVRAIADLQNPSIDGIERLNGVEVYRISGTLPYHVFLRASGDHRIGSTGSPEFPHRVVFWVGVEDSLVRKISAEGVIEDNQLILNSSMTIEYSDFGEEIVIEEPELGATP